MQLTERAEGPMSAARPASIYGTGIKR
jgi:hypothetical protein